MREASTIASHTEQPVSAAGTPAAGENPSKTLRVVSIFVGGNLVATALGVIGATLQVRYVGPAEMGMFRTFTIVVGYLSFLHLGTIDGLQRQLPCLIGSGRRDRAETAAGAGLAWNMLASATCALVLLGLAIADGINGRWKYCCGWIAHIPLLVSGLYGLSLGTTYRAGGDFARLSMADVAQSVLGLALLPFVAAWQYYGVCIRAFFSFILKTALLHRLRPMRVPYRLRFGDLWGLLRIGLPLSLIGYIATSFWWSLEGSIVLRWFGVEALGLFSVVVLFRQTVCQLVLNVNQIYMPRIAEQFGRSGQIGDCLRLSVKPTVLTALAALAMMAAGWALIPPAVRIAIPKYAGAVSAMQWTLPMMLVLVLRLPLYVLQAAGLYAEHGTSVACGILSFCGAAAVASTTRAAWSESYWLRCSDTLCRTQPRTRSFTCEREENSKRRRRDGRPPQLLVE